MATKDERRAVLKQLLHGRLTGHQAAAKLQNSDDYSDAILVAIATPDGQYAIGSDSGLTKEEAYRRVSKDVHVIVAHDNPLLTMLKPVDVHSGYYR